MFIGPVLITGDQQRKVLHFSHCTECRSAFLLRANVPPDRGWLRLKFQLLVARDHTLIFFIVQLVTDFMGMNCEKCLVMKSIHMLFMQRQYWLLFWLVCCMDSS